MPETSSHQSRLAPRITVERAQYKQPAKRFKLIGSSCAVPSPSPSPPHPGMRRWLFLRVRNDDLFPRKNARLPRLDFPLPCLLRHSNIFVCETRRSIYGAGATSGTSRPSSGSLTGGSPREAAADEPTKKPGARAAEEGKGRDPNNDRVARD